MDMKTFLTVVMMIVMTSHCSALLTACENNGNCTADQANSECDLVTDTDGAGDGECVCVNLYIDDGSSGCARGLGASCSADGECSTVSNSECSTTCQCVSGYTQSGSTCSGKSGVSVSVSTMFVVCAFAITLISNLF